MKTALLLIPVTNDKINRPEYIHLCIKDVLRDGCMPFTPDSYVEFSDRNRREYVGKIIPYIDRAYLFVDFGIDDLMFETIDRLVAKGMEPEYRRLVKEEIEKVTCGSEWILYEVSKKTGIPVKDIKSTSRRREVVDARFIYCRRTREMTRLSFAQIGQLINRDHATVLFAVKQATTVKEVIKEYEKYYGPTTSKTATMEQSSGGGNRDMEQGERSLLSHVEVDKSLQGFPAKAFVMPQMREAGLYCAVGSYGSCYPEGSVSGSLGRR